jgi:phosphate transport system permease protein
MHDIRTVLARRKRQDFVFNIVGMACTLVGVVTLGALLVDLILTGVARLDGPFLTSFPSRRAAQAGIFSAWVGTVVVMLVTALTAVPLGVAAGVYLEEYGHKNWLTALIEINIANLAGVPSIIYGLMALGLFAYQLRLGQSILAAGLTLACLILPIVIVATREALRAIPGTIREACPTRWVALRQAPLSACPAPLAKPRRSLRSERSPLLPFCPPRQSRPRRRFSHCGGSCRPLLCSPFRCLIGCRVLAPISTLTLPPRGSS